MAVGPPGALRAEGPQHAVADLADETALRHRHHPERRGAQHLVGPRDPEVLDAVAHVGSRPALLGLGVGVEDEVDGGVADGVGGHAPPRAVGLEDAAAQRLGVVLEVAPLAGGVGEVLAHGGGVADQRAVGEHLDRPEPQPVVAQAGAHAQVEAERHVVVDVRGERVQRVGGHHQLHPHGQAALLARGEVRRDLDRALADPAAAHAGLDHRGDALREVDPPARSIASTSVATG